MVQPRKTRSKRAVPQDSDDEYVETAANGSATTTPKSVSRQESIEEALKRVKSPTNPTLSPHRTSIDAQSATASPSPTPKRSKRVPSKQNNTKTTKREGGKPIFSFFNAVTQKQQDKPNNVDAAAAEDAAAEPKDAIEDDSSEDGKAQGHTVTELAVRKRSRDGSDVQHSSRAGSAGPSLKFLKGRDGRRTPSFQGHKPDQDSRPWTEKYGPSTLEDLVVHKRKVGDVRQWFEKVISRQSEKRVLILKGVAGTGKTVTVNLLAKSMGYEVIEWKNPSFSDFRTEGYTSVSSQFEDFLNRGRRYNTLEFEENNNETQTADSNAMNDQMWDEKQLILVEEFPTNISSPSGFRSALSQYLAANTPSRKDFFAKAPESQRPPTPVVMVVSESVLSNSGNSSDNFTAHRLFGQDILSHPGVSVIEFNAVAPTFITKALNLVVQKHGRTTGQYLYPPTEVIQKIADIGDVRNAVSTLEFFCLQTEASAFQSQPVKPKSKKSKSNVAQKANPAAGEATSNAISLLSLRESTLGLFHAVGRVVYNKRSASNGLAAQIAEIEAELPPHLSHLARSIPSEVDIERLIDETGTDVSTFISSLHENFILSCYPTAPNTEVMLDSINGCLDGLSDADINGRRGNSRPGYYASGVDTMLQEDVSFQTSVRSVLFNLPYPVKRKAPGGWAAADANKMFYPTSLRLWRKSEELQGKLDWFVERAFDGRLLSELQRQNSRSIQFSPAKRTKSSDSPNKSGTKAPPFRGGDESKEDDDSSASLPYVSLGSGHSARQEMVLERLPYVALIASKKSSSGALTKDIEAITKFSGLGTMREDEDEDVEHEVGTPSKASKIKEGGRRGLFGTPAAFSFKAAGNGKSESDLDMQKLVLSDDDIEDD